jgi:hypothetical protein
LLADVMALSRDPTVAVAADIGDPPLIQPGAEVTVQHPLRLRHLPMEAPAKEPRTAGFTRREAQ